VADDPTDALRRTVDGVSELITDYARALQLGGSEHSARLDPVELPVSYLPPGEAGAVGPHGQRGKLGRLPPGNPSRNAPLGS
jgi:hypothetical protein